MGYWAIRRRHRSHPAQPAGEPEVFELDVRALGGLFAAPTWLRDLGLMAWLLVGVAALTVGVVWLLSLTQTITVPVVTAAILAAVLSPVVRRLHQAGLPRALGTAIVLLAIAVAGVLLLLAVLGGITDEASTLTAQLRDAADAIKGWLGDLGIDQQTAQRASDDASSSLSSAFHFLITGLGHGLHSLASLAVFLSFTVLSLFFMLKDGPAIREWGERHLGIPLPMARIVTHRTIDSLRGYFTGVTAVAAFNGIVVGLGALVLGVPNAGSIAVVNFACAYVPYLGAWSAGAFSVLIALGSQGTDAALVMIVIVLLANGALQQLIQPVAFGAALGIHPLAVLVVTIAGGSLFGTIGLVIAAPLTSAAVRISADVARARAAEHAAAEQAGVDGAEQPAGEPAPS